MSQTHFAKTQMYIKIPNEEANVKKKQKHVEETLKGTIKRKSIFW